MMKPAYQLTKIDIAALRAGNMLSVHLTPEHPAGLVRITKNAPEKSPANPFPTEQTHIIEAPVSLQYDWHNPDGAPNARCFSLMYLYQHSYNTDNSVISQLRAGDEIRWRFYPDALTNGYCRTAGLHGDALYLDVTRGKKTLSYQMDTSICPNNEARMCRGVPSRDEAQTPKEYTLT